MPCVQAAKQLGYSELSGWFPLSTMIAVRTRHYTADRTRFEVFMGSELMHVDG